MTASGKRDDWMRAGSMVGRLVMVFCYGGMKTYAACELETGKRILVTETQIP